MNTPNPEAEIEKNMEQALFCYFLSLFTDF